MSTATAVPPTTILPVSLTVTDLHRRFGPMPLKRICFDPLPGNATEQDILDIQARERRLYELVDGILVEKIMGFPESALACSLIQLLRNWIVPKQLGVVAGEAGMMRLVAGLVRIPDVSFVPWERIPNRQIPADPIPDLFPELAVEVLSPGNTREEMEQKLREYFGAGTKLVWFVDPRQRTVTVYTAPDQSVELREDQTLDGGVVLPGFTLSLHELFAELDPH